MQTIGVHAAVTLLVTVAGASAATAPSFYNAVKSGQTFSFAFRAAADVPYQVQYRDIDGTWKEFRSVMAGPGGEVTITDSAAVTPSRFYRVAPNDFGFYSCNAVGYVNVTCRPHLNLIANPLFNAPNRLTQLISTAPDDTVVWKAGPNGPECAAFYDGAWHDCTTGLESEMTLYPGEGALLITHEEFLITFVGEVVEGTIINHLPAGLSLCSSIVPQSGPVTSMLGFPARPGDMLYQFDRATQTYRSYTFAESGWRPSEPNISVAEPFWVELGEAATWVRHFDVTPFAFSASAEPSTYSSCSEGYSIRNYEYPGTAWVPGRQPPVIISTPHTKVAKPGADVILNVEASGSPRLRYQWCFGDREIGYGTNTTLRLSNVQPGQRGSYSVMVSNDFGCVTGAVARLIVEERPALEVQSGGNHVMVCWPESATAYVLEQSDSLQGEWTEVSTASTVENGRKCVTAPILASPRFYRLRRLPE